jgi:uncharacterized membrane protein
MNMLLLVLALVASLGAGLVAGVFYAFSTFVMKALARLPETDGNAAMQSINVAVINPLFLGLFLGMALLSLGLAVVAVVNPGAPGAILLLVGALFYLVGTFGVTMAGNVPLNNALARHAAASPEGAAVWRRYLARWTLWNHVRTAAAAVAAGCFAVAFRLGFAPPA